MFRQIESYHPQTQLLERLQSMFPAVNIAMPSNSGSLLESLEVPYFLI